MATRSSRRFARYLRKKALAAGFTLHLAKPIDPAELVSVVATMARFLRRR